MFQINKWFSRLYPRSVQPIPTNKMYTNISGTYTENRRILHSKIINHLLKKAGPSSSSIRPQAYLLGGGTASGKTTILQRVIKPKLHKQGITALIINADQIKKYIPEYVKLQKKYPLEAAQLVHKESRDIASQLLAQAVEQKRHFVLESTFASAKRSEKLIEWLKNSGYYLHLYIADVPVEQAIRRSDKRGKRTGRFVPHAVIRKTHRLVPRTFRSIKDQVDRHYVYSNEKELKLIVTKSSIREQHLYNSFLQKGGSPYRFIMERRELRTEMTLLPDLD